MLEWRPMPPDRRRYHDQHRREDERLAVPPDPRQRRTLRIVEALNRFIVAVGTIFQCRSIVPTTALHNRTVLRVPQNKSAITAAAVRRDALCRLVPAAAGCLRCFARTVCGFRLCRASRRCWCHLDRAG